jgi:DNA invertase Pin-like site-specific DNA recombinase
MSAIGRRSEAQRQIVRAIIYARVSKDEARGRSVKEQIAGCTDDCAYESWTPGLILQDNDRGASRHSRREREDFNKLPDILQAGDVLVVWEPSRITRDMREFGVFCDLIADRGVLLYYDDRIYDLRDDDDRNHVWQDILDAAKQAGKTRKRTLRALGANRTDRKPHGRLSPGYRIIRDADGKSVGREVIPGQARVLQEAARRRLAGEGGSWKRLSVDLKPEWRAAGGVGRFAPEDLKRIMTNPFIYGLYAHKGEILGPGAWEGILPPEQYEPIRNSYFGPVYTAVRGQEPAWLVSYIVRCQVCLDMGERGEVSHKPSPKSVSGHAYVCKKFNHVFRDMEKVDSYVTELLLQLLEDPETLQKLQVADGGEQAAIDLELSAIQGTRNDIARFVADASASRLSAAVVSAYVGPLEEDIRAAQARVAALTKPVDPVLAGIVGPNARRDWEGCTIVERREIIRSVMTVTMVRVPRRGRYSDVGVEVEPIGALA